MADSSQLRTTSPFIGSASHLRATNPTYAQVIPFMCESISYRVKLISAVALAVALPRLGATRAADDDAR